MFCTSQDTLSMPSSMQTQPHRNILVPDTSHAIVWHAIVWHIFASLSPKNQASPDSRTTHPSSTDHQPNFFLNHPFFLYVTRLMCKGLVLDSITGDLTLRIGWNLHICADRRVTNLWRMVCTCNWSETTTINTAKIN